MSGHQFLLELLCEEIPANALAPAAQELATGLTERLHQEGFSEVRCEFCGYTSRRLTVALAGLPARQPDRSEEVLGPPVRAAFAADGSPTAAALGFARGQGVEVEALRVVEGPRGQVVAVTRLIRGEPTPAVLARAVEAVVPSLRFPKTMRWGGGEHTFVRPLHRVVALFGAEDLDEVVPLTLFGVRAGGVTLGHRVAHPGPVELRGTAGVREYLHRLREAGVVVDPGERRQALGATAASLAAQVGCVVRRDEALVAEHVDLLEYPGLVRGAIPVSALVLPEEVLVTTLRHHQKCLVLESEGHVAPHFLAVMDRADDPRGLVREGNEWVVGARLADAAFFFAQDRRRPLADHARGLARVQFHQKLGSYAEKAGAVVALARWLAAAGGAAVGPEEVEAAATLARADLVTGMVGEFPELQGVMGGIYARLDGHPEAVWRAIYDHYRPAGLEGELPVGVLGAVVGVADRLDTLAGMFAVGEIPSGSKDPFALRRAALAVIRLSAEMPLAIDLRAAIERAVAGRATQAAGREGEVIRQLADFLRERERFYLTSKVGVTGEVADGVLEAHWGVVPEDVARAHALEAVRQEPVFAQLAVTFKRVRNILAKGERGAAEARSLVEPAELALQQALEGVAAEVDRAVGAGDHAAGLRALAALAAPLDRFFVDVMVMCEDPALRQARLALLARLEGVFLRLADLSRLGGATA